jgi:deoxyribodipyrimidine photo-lyase
LRTALLKCKQIFAVFVFDTDILSGLPQHDRRVEFIWESVRELDLALRAAAGRSAVMLLVRHGRASDEIPALAFTLGVQAVFAARDYEPQAIARDANVRQRLSGHGIAWEGCKDQVIFEGPEVLTQQGTPYSVFTPYKAAWLARLQAQPLPAPEPAPTLAHRLASAMAEVPPALQQNLPELEQLGFARTNLRSLRISTGATGAQALLGDFLPRLDDYHRTRDFPGIKGPSYLSVHLRFGTVSIRQLVVLAQQSIAASSAGAAIWLSELIWREFYFAILHHHPHVAERAFKPAYDAIAWESGPQAQAHFDAWCKGTTGYPLVDAAMRQLNTTGYMHNRLRMVAASFLVKDLGLDWRWGERYFAQTLNDFDLAANNGGWQWAASTGCDAQPYFRIFNPVSQSQKFDPQGQFIRRYVPELAALPNAALHAPWQAKPLELQAAGVVLGHTYPHPLVDHAQARARTLARYAVVKGAAA